MSRQFWTGYQVARFEPGQTVDESLSMLAARRDLYPGMADLMLPAQLGTVLDFGCGPGHDTIEFLLAGARHVYAADFSPAAVASTQARIDVHGFQTGAHVLLIEGEWKPPKVDHVHAAGVIHHCEDPVGVLRQLRGALNHGAEIRMMVYDADSWFYRVACGSDPDYFRLRADAGAPIAYAWTRPEVEDLAHEAGLKATYLGSYMHPGELAGPGLSACYRLT